jgi:hypothetical protein
MRRLVAAGIVALAAMACGSSGENGEVDGTCLPPAPQAVPLKCGINCTCGSGGRCAQGKCVSCGCKSNQFCSSKGTCVNGSQPGQWYERSIGAACYGSSPPPPS